MHHLTDQARSQYSALEALGLLPGQLTALRYRGSISTEMRGPGMVHKLRFRFEGRQVNRCIRPELLEGAVRELAELQLPFRRARSASAIARQIAKSLRQQKLDLMPVLATRGLVFHGNSIRKPHRIRRKK